jgi:hypothetical protein
MGLDLYISLFDVAKYRQLVEPTLRNYFGAGRPDEILLLLQDAKLLSSNSEFCDIQSSIDILNGTEFYGPAVNHIPPYSGAKATRADLDTYVRSTVVGQLLDCLCVPRIEGGSSQNMGRSDLVPYLYEHSPWIEHAFTGGILDTGIRLDFPLGEHAEIVATEKVETFLSELNSIPKPDSKSMPTVAKQLSNLRQILVTTLRDSRWGALLYLR